MSSMSFELAVEVLQLVEHVLVPEAAGLEVLHEEGIEDDEVAARGCDLTKRFL